jgi:diguanylate cyclase (GGDEF)-like protein
VHANTVRAWTDQGRLRCLRINERGDRRYRVADLQAFLDDAELNVSPARLFVSRLRPPLESVPAQPAVLRPLPAARPELLPATLWHTERPQVPPPVAQSRHGQARASRSPEPAANDARGAMPEGPAVPDSALVARTWDHAASQADLDESLRAVVVELVSTGRFRSAAVVETTSDGPAVRTVEGSAGGRTWLSGLDQALVEKAQRNGSAVVVPTPALAGPIGGRARRPTSTVYAQIRVDEEPWGAIVVETVGQQPTGADLDLLAVSATSAAVLMDRAGLLARIQGQRERAADLIQIAAELGSQLDQPTIMRQLLERLVSLFGADRAAVWRIVDGDIYAEATHNLSSAYVDAVRSLTPPPIGAQVTADGPPVIVRGILNHASAKELHEAASTEGIDTIALAPLAIDGELVGALGVYHDRPFAWAQDDVDLLASLGAQAGIAIKNARNYQLMATWAAQLQSIQQLGTRLNRWGTVKAIGQAIAGELRQLIDYHNVRVYRVYGDIVEPVAWRGEIGEYTDEDDEQLRLTVGSGITGWVAQHGVPQYLPDAARDPRSQTIPGTEADMPESMLIAPMLYEDHVLGVIVLSKLGVNQFTGDDLRYLEIYASMAAQAMVNADATEQLRAQSDRLARQLDSQQELMRITESILSTLDPRAVVEEIAERLSGLLRVDNISIGVRDAKAGVIRPLLARGVDADRYLARLLKDDEGVSGWVIQHGEAQLVQDEQADERVIGLDGAVPAGALIVAPLRSRDQVTGVLLLERLGSGARFEEQEFELIELFAGHVAIALQNALAHQAVEIKAQTDLLTGLKNQGTFHEYVQHAVKRGTPFSLLIVDLDDFKAFNDRRGHEAGNVLLATIADALRTSCRDSDEVFRYGGDEFALILPNTDMAGAMEVASKVGRAVSGAPSPGLKRPAGVTCSVGAAHFPADASDRDGILLAADRACYVAKAQGKGLAVTAAQALALAGDILPQPPTPVDDPNLALDAA